MNRISRREFIRVSVLATAGVAAAACAKTAEPTTSPKEQATATPKPAAATATPKPVEEPAAKEAPDLIAKVKAGDLPALAERLPDNPVVVQVVDRIGTYGGQFQAGTIEKNGNFWTRNGAYEQLTRWTPKWDGLIANIAESFEVNDDATEYTFKLRKGIKYSDGAPFSADDIMFWFNDFQMNEELNPSEPKRPFTYEKIDDFTVKRVYEQPHGLFIKEFTRVNSDRTCYYPMEYMQQFHAAYNKDIDAAVKESGQASWMDLFNFMNLQHQNSDVPVLFPWVMQSSIGEATTRIISERNPYYFKVDPEGNQLPYIDRMAIGLVAETEALVLQALNGEIDVQERHITEPKNKSVYFDNMEKGKYHLIDLTPTTVNAFIIQLNMNCDDPVKREIFENKDFRIGLSYAIDRNELNDVVYVSQGAPHQAAPRPESRFYHERLATQYTEFDLDKANEHLDKTGWTERDADGFRIGPDGKRISFIMELDQGRTTYIDTMELVKPIWEKVGVEVNVKTMERSLWEERCRGRNLEFHASGHRFGGGSGDAVILDPRYWIPSSNGSSMFAKRWAFWFNDPEAEDAEEPPEQVREAMALYESLYDTGDDEEHAKIMKQILDIAADYFYAIGTILEPNAYAIVTDRMQNVPMVMPQSWIYPTPAPYNPAQWFIDEG
jgi:peptide/nickel transport system substrate-binding protein